MKRMRLVDIVLHHRRMLSRVIVFSAALSSLPGAQSAQRYTPDTLAVVGNKVITTQQFARLFKEKLISLGLSDNGDTRNGYLRNLVDDEVLIAHAKRKKLDRTQEALRESKRFRLQELLNAYADKHIVANVDVTESDLQELFQKMNAKVKVRHLYAPTRERADSIYTELSRGRTFEDLAREVFTDPHLRENGGSLGYISFDEMDPVFEQAAYAMKPGDISRPVKTVYGYSIIKVDDIQRNPFVTESEFLKAKDRLRGFVRKQKCEEAAAQHVTALRAELGVRFNGPLLTRLYELTQQKSLNYLIENSSLALSAEDLKKSAVTSTLGRWSVRGVIDALSETPEGQRRWIHTREDLEDVIAGLIVRQYIAREAKKEHLDAAPSFQERVQYAFDTYLLTTLEGQLRKQIRISPDSVQSYYQHNKDKFTTQPEIRLSGILLDNAGISDSVRHLLESGADFDGLAKQFSIQRATAEYGGDLGTFTRGQLGPLGTQLFALKIGEWGGPFVQEGKHLFVKCSGVKESIVRSLHESSKEIEGILVAMAWQTARSHYVEALKSTIRSQTYPARLMAISLTN
jgi:parvulin-like peptidyl-prolyl isomerase